ncbi:hypothetical protein [Legionella pneumophila]|uniref:Dolichyl-phosphate mannosyltransferase n=1 Tax=Legionella pneumophila subsp. pascullei TaxID=91890 RepID=A0AAX2J1M2_LEGPN|nr:hypothetical protein [Legionella pneumophila]AMP90876.1 hypothetical protein AXF35_14720 [Legionella pneumophila subsp. pascullei]AMP93861.1 hypothetical protein AXF36_15085 [Legionella pneumophila subsp. pascullei]AMP96778.1 hypothetical protein AXF37_14720 [Legionella pneumophila subsp. pascullei]SQG91831.1 dolichyl-phosphate mannosyltransferase [Legionella pneumophila subsp. pascullei]VEH08377.1 dolichyl-phosphate mannosyltransferase [Legionella pneumophila subsp. pascullei]
MAKNVSLFLLYSASIFIIYNNSSQSIQQRYFKTIIACNDLTKQFYDIARSIESTKGITPTFVFLDKYATGSELSSYQAKMFAEGIISKIYSVERGHVFGAESLMYRYWSSTGNVIGTPLIVISKDRKALDNPKYKNKIVKSPLYIKSDLMVREKE